jgi:glycosyltransferase involved in cell wall biosynthesis
MATVLVLTSARNWRGSGVSLGKIATGLAERGHRVFACAGSRRVLEGFASLGLSVVQVPTADTGLREIRALRAQLRALNCEAVVADKARDLRLAGWATLQLPIAVLYRYNLSPSGPAPSLADRLVLARARMCIFQAAQVRSAALARIPLLARIPNRVVYNGYDTARYRPRPEAGMAFRARHGLAADRLVVLTLAALEMGKGQDVALRALARLQADGLSVTYLIAGEGKHAERVRVLAEASRVPTVLTGYLQVEEAIGALNAANLYLHPAREEIFPNAVAEAMACGRTVITSDVGGLPELVGPDGQAGLIVPADNDGALADAIAGCLADEERRRRLGAAARRRIEECFPLSAMVEGYERAMLAAVGA